MTRMQLTRQVSRITGEPASTVTRLGFSEMHKHPDVLEPEDVELVLDCPFCGHHVPYPGPASDGSETLAECDRCDVYFGFDPDEVYTIARDGRSASLGSPID